jgi:hypothetical protein
MEGVGRDSTRERERITGLAQRMRSTAKHDRTYGRTQVQSEIRKPRKMME